MIEHMTAIERRMKPLLEISKCIRNILVKFWQDQAKLLQTVVQDKGSTKPRPRLRICIVLNVYCSARSGNRGSVKSGI